MTPSLMRIMVELKKINEFTWEIPKQEGMKVPGIIYASEKLLEKIKQDTERDFFMDAEEAMNYGIIDKVIKRREVR